MAEVDLRQADLPACGDRPSILLVDDDAVIRTSMAVRLKRLGYRVIEADNGRAGLSATREHRPNLVILDWMMPGLDGPSVCEAIRADPALKACQIVLMTGHDEPDQIAEGLARGADDFLSKAASQQEIMARVRANLRANALVREIERTRDDLDRSNQLLSAKQRELEGELQSAADFVASLLPSEGSPFPGINISCAYRPSLALGGDLFQVCRWGSQALGLFILDASGHGVAAALRAAGLMSFLHEDNLAKLSDVFDPGVIVTEANRLFPLTAEGEYFTLWVGRIDLSTWGLAYATAGHAGALLQRGGDARWLASESFPLGFDAGTVFKTHDLALYAQDRLFLFSDGIYEAPSPSGEMWGRLRLKDQLIASRGCSLTDSVGRTIDLAARWLGSDQFPDDVALLGVEMGILSSVLQGDEHAG